MRIQNILLIFAAHILVMSQNPKEPRAKEIPRTLSIHGDTRIDPYFWLNERENPAVIQYLNEENAFLDKSLSQLNGFRTDLFDEMKGRIKEDDQSVPYQMRGFWYQTRFEQGKEYPIMTRREGNLKAEEDILFDVNKMAVGYGYYNLRGVSIAPNNKLAGFGTDTVGRRIYTLQFKDLSTGKILDDKIENTTGSCVWAEDNETVFYTRKDETLRSYRIYTHRLGTDPKTDKLVYEEKDPTFSCYVYKSKSRDFIFIGSYATLSSEVWMLPANKPNGTFKLVQGRERDLEYDVMHFGRDLYIRTNKDKSRNFKLMKTPIAQPQKENWQNVIPHREDVYLEGVEIFKDFLVLEERENGLNKIRVKHWDNSEDYHLPMPEETYDAAVGRSLEFDTSKLRYTYTSMTTPYSVREYDMQDKSEKNLKTQEVVGDFKQENYTSERLWATARDGKKVAISLVRRKDTELNANTPLMLYGYGSYGATIDPTFSTTRLSLLDRGFVFAIAHIRGGQYLGRNWYEDGKLLNKKNTFFDFIDCAKFLIKKNYTSSQHLYASGGSAGGLLMGAVINLEPELFNGVLAGVPFVDVVTTMLDDSIPLTTGEYDEWGNPNDKVYYDYIKSYSPYDNIAELNYPNLLITTGLHDSQVQYWEPAKWIAKIRALRSNNNALFMHTNMEAGHGGASGRFESLKETALEYAFILQLENILN